MPADWGRAGDEPVFQRIAQRICGTVKPFFPEFKRQEPPLGIIYGDNPHARIAYPVESQQFPVSMP